MRRNILLLALLLGAAGMAWGQSTATQRLVVWLADGTTVSHDLTDEPETTFQDGALFLKTDKVTVSYPLDKVLRYTYEGEFPKVGIQPVRSGEVRFSQGADEMRFDGLPAGTTLELYSPDGRLLAVQTAAEGQPAVISLKGRPTGTYIVKAGDASYKFLKK